MTTMYPSQSTPQFLKKYTRNVYNRVQHNAHVENGHLNNEEAALALQVYSYCDLLDWKSHLLFNQCSKDRAKKKNSCENSRRKKDACKNKHFLLNGRETIAKNNDEKAQFSGKVIKFPVVCLKHQWTRNIQWIFMMCDT